MSQDDQKKYFGWDGVGATINSKIKGWMDKRQLNVKESCGGTESACKISCRRKIINVLNKSFIVKKIFFISS